MDIGEAVGAIMAIDPEVVIPIHRLGADPRALAVAIESKSDANLVSLDIGEAFRSEI